MVGESAVETFWVTWATSCDDSGDDVSWSGPFDHPRLTPRCPIGPVKSFCDSGCPEPFLDLSTSGDNLPLLSEVVIPFFGDVFFRSLELLFPLAEGPFFSPQLPESVDISQDPVVAHIE